MNTTKIIKEINKKQFKELLKEKNIHISEHVSFHLSNAQRNIYSKEYLLRVLFNERIYFVGLQKNNRYAVYYKRKIGFLKIIISKNHNKLDVVTFLNTKSVQKVIK